jgi:transposase
VQEEQHEDALGIGGLDLHKAHRRSPRIFAALRQHSPQSMHLIDSSIVRVFNKLKHFRRIATRYDKLARNFLAALLIASTRLWLRAYQSTT